MRSSGTAAKTATPQASAFVANGRKRALAAIEAEVRVAVEQKYADEWNTSGLVKRWWMLRGIKREIARRRADRCRNLSPDALF